jgi:hypothetical protein
MRKTQRTRPQIFTPFSAAANMARGEVSTGGELPRIKKLDAVRALELLQEQEAQRAQQRKAHVKSGSSVEQALVLSDRGIEKLESLDLPQLRCAGKRRMPWRDLMHNTKRTGIR